MNKLARILLFPIVMLGSVTFASSVLATHVSDCPHSICNPDDAPTLPNTGGNNPSAGSGGSVVYLPTETEIGISDRDVFSTLVRVGEFIATLIGILAILAIIVSGIMYITSGGDTGRTATAKGILTYAIIGLVVALLAWVIVYTISKTLGT